MLCFHLTIYTLYTNDIRNAFKNANKVNFTVRSPLYVFMCVMTFSYRITLIYKPYF